MDLSANNTAVGVSSDVGFLLRNDKIGFEWVFRTMEADRGFSMTKLGSGGPELEIKNTTTNYQNVSLVMGNGAYCSSSGQWINASSRDFKENIQELKAKEALEALSNLSPVKYNFKRDAAKDTNVGFIAEDVPDLVATKDRKGMNSLTVVAVLTKVVKEQQKMISELSGQIAELEKMIAQRSTESTTR